MKPSHLNIKQETLNNNYYRKVLYTLPNFQLVVMSLKPGEEIGGEVHNSTHQYIKIEQGQGYAQIGDKYYELYDDVSIVIPFNTYHNIVNNGNIPMKLYTIYSGQVLHPPNSIDFVKPIED